MVNIVGTLNVRFSEHQVVGALIDIFSKHQWCNVNLDYLTFWVSTTRCKLAKNERFGDSGLVASPMIKSAKIWRGMRE